MSDLRDDAVRWAERVMKRPDGYDSEYVNAARYILSPPAAGPGFDAEDFLWEFSEEVGKCHGMYEVDREQLKFVREEALKELRTALGVPIPPAPNERNGGE